MARKGKRPPQDDEFEEAFADREREFAALDREKVNLEAESASIDGELEALRLLFERIRDEMRERRYKVDEIHSDAQELCRESGEDYEYRPDDFNDRMASVSKRYVRVIDSQRKASSLEDGIADCHARLSAVLAREAKLFKGYADLDKRYADLHRRHADYWK